MSETRPKTIAQVAQYALNGWAIYATRKIEHDDIALLWSELKAMSERSEPAAASVPLLVNADELANALLAEADELERERMGPGDTRDHLTAVSLMRSAARSLSSAPGEREAGHFPPAGESLDGHG